MSTTPLEGKVALVAGATRGAGRAIAIELATAGATVYATGRSSRTTGRSEMDRPETIEGTSDKAAEAGGEVIAAVCDHLDARQVRDLVSRIETEQGRLDILVNNIWGGDPFTTWDKTMWEQDLGAGLHTMRLAIDTHLITSHAAIPLLIKRSGGLLVEVTDGDTVFNAAYRGTFFYDLCKVTPHRVASNLASELAAHEATAISLTPGWIRSEAMLDHFGVTADNWRDGATQEEHFVISETPHFVARCLAAVAADEKRHRFNGQSLASWNLADEYDINDVDGSRPHMLRYFREVIEPGKPANTEGYR